MDQQGNVAIASPPREVQVNNRAELTLRDKLAVDRTIYATDRSLLAGVRTSVNFIGLGFTIYNVLRYLQEHNSAKLMGANTPRNFRALHVGGGNGAT